MNSLYQPPMPRLQPQLQSAVLNAMPGAPQLQPGQNQLQSPPQPQQANALQAPQRAQLVPPQPQISPQQVQDAHEHLDDMQQTIHELIKKPDSELSVKHIFRAAADLVVKHQLHDGKRGMPAAMIAAELSSPDFPKEDARGNPPSPAVIRQFLQNRFDQAVSHQAAVTAAFGPPIPNVPQSQDQGIHR